MTGILAISADEYHADPCERPSLSASIAAILCAQSPAHAWTAHPRLNPDCEQENKAQYDLGTAAHQLLLEGHTDSVVPIAAENFRTKAAQEARDEAYTNGKVPILIGDLPRLRALVDAAAAQFASHEADPPPFANGLAEQTLIWEEAGGVICRARLDWLHNGYQTVDDLKTTGRSANPEAYSRALFGVGGDVQAAMYVRGVEKLTGVVPEFRWVVVETQPPYAVSVVAPGPDVLTIGRKKVGYALALWRRCLERGEWPGYPNQVCYANLPAWEESRWLEREGRAA